MERDARRAGGLGRLRERFGWADRAPAGIGPALILLSGLPGTGKSYVARALAERFGVLVLRSDEVRKALFDRPEYSGAESGVVYLTCYALLRAALMEGHAVVFDATNLTRGGRRRATRIAQVMGAPLLTLVTVAPSQVVAARLASRAAGRAEAFSSDADWQVHQKLAGSAEPVGGPYLQVDTAGDVEPALARVGEFLRCATRAGYRTTSSARGCGDA